VYKQKHYKHFGDKFKDMKYQSSDAYIMDFINFFDENDKLLLAINKWNLIDYVAKENTKASISYTNQYSDPMIRNNAEYYVAFKGTQIFNICYLWLMNNKDKTPQELFDMIKYFNQLHYQ
ncbi:MAG: hypothetical protein LUG46_02240, partial [Erysipelotrichaceae bacterium]|nr:hypothetical protein [Erysipelotrichaceae bacterium]